MSLSFLQNLYTPYSTDDGLLCEIRCLPIDRDDEPTARYFGLTHLHRAAEYARAQSECYDVYMGVLPRFQKTGKAGNDRDVNAAAWLWCDIDRGAASDSDMISFLQHVKTRIALPHMVVSSGSGGAHLYWRLGGTERLETDEQRSRFTSILRRVVAAIGTGSAGIHADKSCCNPSRILRVPHTLNHKHSPPRKVEGLITDQSETMSLDQWDAVLPMEPFPARWCKPKIKVDASHRADGFAPGLIRWAEQGYPEGNRHHDLVGAAAWLRRSTDLPEDKAWQLFMLKADRSPGLRPITLPELEKAWGWAA